MGADWNEGKQWNDGGVRPQPAKRGPTPGYWKTDAACVYPLLKSEARQTTRIAAKPEPRLARGLLPDVKRGSVSPLGGVATPAPKKPGMKW
jgi:hypothetical protein